ncbi:MAG: OPT/YSL family transporter [Oscillospiraceae bacterium]|nr:OPT/YSL family transporter [Oscillospiraceae bacterium]
MLYILKVPSITLGIGMVLPFGVSLAVVIGGLIRFVVDKFFKKKTETGMIVASGIFGGETITGVIIAFIVMFTA